MNGGRRRRHQGARPADMEHQPRQYKPRRQRSRDMDWHTTREFSKTVQCEPPPRGCRAPIGTTCHNPATGAELGQQPAHQARIDKAHAAEPRDGEQPITEEDPF